LNRYSFSIFSSDVAEVEVSEDGVRESEEFFLVNFTWGLGVNLFSGCLDPGPFVSGDDVVLGFSKLLKSSFDLIVGEGSTTVGVKHFETFSGLFLVDASSINFWHFFFSFSSEMAEVEVLEDSVGELVEFFLVNFTWGLGVNLFSGFLDPFPFISGDCVVEGFSKFFKSNLDFIVGEGTTVVGVKRFESFMGESFGDASFSLS